MKTWLVTGGAGFIGSNFILSRRARRVARIINLDKLTYAGNLGNLERLRDDPDHVFVHGDIRNSELVRCLLDEHKPDAVIHFAAESHVDRSIIGPDAFIKTNIVGTFSLLEEVYHYWKRLESASKKIFRFLNISTDEVYGSLGTEDPSFTESNPYAPSSPYSASKAAADHIVRSYHKTYGLPILITISSNNYGPYQFPEKLIPLMILNALEGKPLPIYGDGKHIRDWLYVDDHCDALELILEKGNIGETYNISGCCEKSNDELMEILCGLLDRLCPDSPFRPHASLITHVKDRPGHDRRYAIDSSKIKRETGWEPLMTFIAGLEKTIQWYIDNTAWVESVKTDAYLDWITKNYRQR